jgi:MoaA/NifB/PqqE/SkfB family radical SAM enzyme
MLAGLLTNGLLLSEKRILSLNRAGLDHLQISIDNVQPDEVSKKSLKVLDKKLQLLGRHAEFDVNINSVLSGDLENPYDALTIGRRAIELGLTSTLGIIHDDSGQLKPLPEQHRGVFEEFGNLGKGIFKAPSHNAFQENIVQGRPNSWDCHAGSRYVYVCEDGLVHYCSQQRGTPGIPLAEYSVEDLDMAYRAPKSCAPLCTISCVHRVSWMDRLRETPEAALAEFFPPKNGQPWSLADLPFRVRILARMFLRDQNGRKPPLARLARAVFK